MAKTNGVSVYVDVFNRRAANIDDGMYDSLLNLDDNFKDATEPA